MDALAFLKQNTWSNLPMTDWELDALAAMVERVEPMTEAERVMRDRVLDSVVRRENVKEMFG